MNISGPNKEFKLLGRQLDNSCVRLLGEGVVMPIFKTLRVTGMHEHILNGRIDCGWESWNSLDSALNELGASHWEIETPLYGNLPGQHLATWPVALILINRSADMAMEVQRQIEKLKNEIAEIGEKFGMSSRAKELQGILDGLLEKTKSPTEQFHAKPPSSKKPLRTKTTISSLDRTRPS